MGSGRGQQKSNASSGQKPEPKNGRSTRQENQARGQEQGESKPNGQEEKNNRAEWEKGENVASDKKPKRPTEKVDHRNKAGNWGELPDYIMRHGRGSMPEVPEKYRKYLEALTKQDKKKGAAKKK